MTDKIEMTEEQINGHNNSIIKTLNNYYLDELLYEICRAKGFSLIDTIKHGTEEYFQIVRENFDEVFDLIKSNIGRTLAQTKLDIYMCPSADLKRLEQLSDKLSRLIDVIVCLSEYIKK